MRWLDRSNKKGFTLLEVMVAIAVMAILVAIAISNFHSGAAKLRDGVSMIQQDLENAQSQAIRQNAFVVVTFKNDGSGYTIFVDNGSGGGTAGDWIQNGTEPTLADVTFSNGIKISNSTFLNNRTRFDARGLITDNGILTLSLNNQTATLDMNNRFGRITTTTP